MTSCFKSFVVLIIACAASLPATAQVDYRDTGPDDAARRAAPQQLGPDPGPQQQQPDVPTQSASAPGCPDCGVVDSMRIVQQAGEASGAGMVVGGLLGGLLGHLTGQGRGNTAATIIGAAGGAFAGNQVEKNVKKGAARYDIGVRMNEGTLRTVSFEADPGFKTGDRVRLIDGRLMRY